MSTHIGAAPGQVAPTVLLPGDPLRARWIAETFLDDAACYTEVRGMYGYTEWIRQQATDMLRGDVALKGGITPMLKIAHLAEAFRMKCEIHHGGNSLNNVANLHVTMAVPNCEYFEVLQPDAAQKYGLVQDIAVDRAGLVHAPTAHRSVSSHPCGPGKHKRGIPAFNARDSRG